MLKLDAANARVVVGPREALAYTDDHVARCELAGARARRRSNAP